MFRSIATSSWVRALESVGTPGDDTLTGTDGNDTLDGLAGHDSLLGSHGHDSLLGGDGNDTLDGGTGDDTMVGGFGNDTFIVDSASDVVQDSSGTDMVLSSISILLADDIENLTLTGTGAIDGTGNDYSNIIKGNDASNMLDGGDFGHDTIYGNGGDDMIDGGFGGDLVYGGAGNDWISSDQTWDTVYGEAGNDTIVGAGTLSGGDGDDLLDASGAEEWGSYRLDGGAGNDTMYASWDHSWTHYGGDGNDSMAATTERVSFQGEAGHDTLIGMGGADLLYGGTGNDSVIGGDGDDVINGGAGSDSLRGGAGKDQVFDEGVGAANVLDGGSGRDMLAVDWTDDTTGIDWTINPTATATVLGNTIARFESFWLQLGSANDRVDASAAFEVSLNGGGGADELIGSATDDGFEDYDGDADTIVGGDGSDWMNADWTGLTGNVHWVIDADETAVVYGNSLSGMENYFLEMGTGNDYIDARQSIDTTIWGGDGNDTFVAGAGSCDLFGDEGRDLLDAGASQVEGWLEGGSGADTLIGGDAFFWLIGDSGNDRAIAGNGTGRGDLGSGLDTFIGGIAKDIVECGGGADQAWGYGADDDLYGERGDDTLYGGDGQDFLTGEAGSDFLQGDAGNDRIYGDSGIDTLTGGAGNDALIGGSKNDLFVFGSLDGWDTIEDYESHHDQLVFSQALMPIGDGDLVVEGAVETAGPGGFGTGAELVIATANISGGITAAKAAAAIGSATGAYADGATALFAVDNGSHSAVYRFQSTDADASVSAEELTLVASLQWSGATSIGDYVFGS